MTATRLIRTMPSLDAATGWLNSGPLDPVELRGRPVLVNFWTLTCINWLRSQPYVRAWAQGYRDDGLVVIGVHTPEFSFEQDEQAVRQAVEDRGIDYPVAIDNDYGIWTAFENHYWPALYFVDEAGMVRDAAFGEGRYQASERTIQTLLGVSRAPVAVEAHGVEAEADWDHLRSAELYLGYERATSSASPHDDESRHHAIPDPLPRNSWGLGGQWTVDAETVVAAEPGSTIAVRFEARDAHLVLSPGPHGPSPFRVRLDGQPPGASHGIDVDEHGNGVLGAGRLYQLIRAHGPVRERVLEITFLEPGARAYAFTFG